MGKPNLLSKQSPGTALFLSDCLRLPYITRSEQDMLSLFPTRMCPHCYVSPESQPKGVVVADSLLWRRIMKKQLKIRKTSWNRKWPPTPIFLPGKFHDHRSLAIYSPWGHRVKHDWACTHRHRHLCLCLQSLEWEPNKAVRIICGFCYFWKKFQINHFKFRYISYTKKFSFEHSILVIAYLYSCVAIITIWSRIFYILIP